MKHLRIDSQSTSSASSLSYEEVRRQILAMLPAPVEFDDDQNLIELGLDSLQMMRMVNKWRKEGVKVTFAELIAAPYLSDWWALLQKNSPAPSSIKDNNIAVQEQPVQAQEETDSPFALTDVQYAYLIGRQDDQPLGGVGCHAYLEIDGTGVGHGRLQNAWEQLFMHHPMLRARFLADGQQEVLSTPYTKTVPVHDLRLYAEDELTLKLESIRARLSHRRLAVEKGEVAGLELSLLPEGRTRLHFDIDLLVADVQSLHILLRDLAAAYARGCQPAAPAHWSFASYLQHETQQRASDRKEAARYWQERLSTLPGAPGLPLKEKPEMIKAPVFTRRNYFMKAEDWMLLQKRSAAKRVTPAMVLLTAYAEILDRWSTHSQFLINIPLFDRQTGDAGIEEVVADFTNLLLLAVDLRTRQSFLDRVHSVQARFHQDVAHAAYSGVQLQRDLARVRPGERDFAPVVFACNLGTPLINEECRQTLGQLSYMISQTPQVWLDFQSYEMDGGLLLAWDSVDQLFPDGMIDQMFAAFGQLMDWLVAHDNDWQATPELLPDLEQQRQNNDSESLLAQPGQCLHSAFFAHAATNPQETALIDSHTDTNISYGELSRYALQVAAFLKEQGIKTGDAVAVTMPRGIDQIAAVLGIMALGGCYVPIGTGQPATRRERIHKKADIRYVLTDDEWAQALDWPEDAVVLSIANTVSIAPLSEPVSISGDSPAYIIFTSGSTGEPKGVEISHFGAWNTVADINARYQVDSGDRILAVSALDFDLSVYDIFGLLSVGGSLVLITEETRRDAAHWVKLVDKYQISLWNSVPVLLDMLVIAAESGQYDSLPIRLTMLSGDWIGLDLPPRLKRVAPHSELVAMGGATEASIWSNFFHVTLPLPEHWTSIPYGRPLTNQAYRVVDVKGRDCPDWVAGELWIGGAGVALGYRGDPVLTEERFVNWNGSRWYRTGDLGRYWPDGTIEFLGRQDFQVKIRGHRIELGEIETAMKQHPGVRDAVVTAVGDARENKHLIGYVVLEQANESSLYDSVNADLKQAEALWDNLRKAGREQEWLNEMSPKDFPVFWAYMERLGVRYICRALKQAGVDLQTNQSYKLDSLMQSCMIQPRYRELIRQWLQILADEGIVRIEAPDTFVIVQTVSEELLEGTLESYLPPAWEQHAQGLLRYLQQMDNANVALLTGELDPLAYFFSDELGMTPNDLMQALPGTKHRNSIAQSIIEHIQHGLQYRSEPLRILEIGARSKALTESLLALLCSDTTLYTCADNSTFFTSAAKSRFKEYSFVHYQLLDIEQNPLDQGFDAHQYDVIIASDSLHRASNIETALLHMQSLLAPGGLLILLEMTRNSRLQQVSTGFLEDGFIHYEDERHTEQRPLLSVEKWQQLLQEQTFTQVASFPEQNDPASVFGQHVIVAQAPLHVTQFNPVKLSGFLSQKLPDFMVPSAFILLNEMPLTSNGKVDRQALPTPDRLIKAKAENAYTAPRTPIETALAAIWCQLFEMDRVGIADNYFELGGDSLLATKLSAMVRSRFEVELSLGRIFEKPTIAGMAEQVQTLMDQREQHDDSAEALPKIIPMPQDRNQPFPLTDIQQAYWVGRSGLYALGNVSTHCYFEIEGQNLDLERINRAWQRLIDHHEMMRAVIMPDGWQQRILEDVPAYLINVNDLRGKGPEEVEAELKQIREEMSHQVLSTDVWPLFDVRASRFGEERVRLHISFDNLIFDGWSMFHLLSEWTRLYHEPDAPLATLELSFRDYVLALEELKASELYQRDLDYWLARLPDLPPAPQLPLAQSPESLTEQRFSRLEAKLSKQVWQKLKKRTAEVGLTPSGILLTAYAETLGAWSKSSRFTINLTQFNRLPLHAQVNDIVGDFTTLTLLAVESSKGKTWLERGRNLQQQLWSDMDHPYVGGVQVQRELAKKTGEHHGVTMPVVFTSALGVNQWNGSETDGKWLGKLVYNITQTPQVWLDHQVVEQDEELLLIWDAVEGLFPEGMLADMFSAYCQLLQRLTDDEAIWQKETSSLISVPRLEARIEANDTDAPVSSETLTGLFAKQEVQQSSHPAVISANRTLTYEELSLSADKIANLLQEKGAKPNTLVAVVMEKGWEQVVATLGILKSGAAYLPIDPAHPKERRSQLLRDGQIRIVLTQSWLDERLSWPEDVERLLVDQMPARNEAMNLLPIAGQPEDLAYVIYTSGSTGLPKGVMIDHRGVVNTIEDVNQRFSVGPQDRLLALSNLNFDLSVYDIFGMLAAGGTIIMPEADKAKDPAHWIEWMKQEQVTVWNTVPALMQMLIEYASGRNLELPQTLRLVLLSGDWIPLDLPDKIKAYFPQVQVIGLGGATEASIWSNLYPIEDIDPSWKSIPYGSPMINQRFYVLNEWMENCPVWVPGQLYIGGIGLAKGYWQDESKTNDKFIYHPHTGERLYRTGDLGRYLPDGNLEFLGREDFQVKIRGHRIELGEIETALNRHDGVKNAIVAVPDESGEEKRLVGYVVLDQQRGAELLETEQADSADCESRWQEISNAGQLQAAQVPDSMDAEAIARFLHEADRVSSAFICRTLDEMGMFSSQGERYFIDNLVRQCKIHQRYKTLLLHWLDVLVEEGLLAKNEDGTYQSLRSLREGLAIFAQDGALSVSPVGTEAVQALEDHFSRDSSLFINLLTGKLDPLELFFTEDASLTPSGLNRFDFTREYYSNLAKEVFCTLVNSYPSDKELRVLEIGTRVGGLTPTLVSALPVERTRYVYADESAFFTDRAKQEWGEQAPLEYGLFDMNTAPLWQGYEPHSFDAIVADNTLHRSRNLNMTLEYLRGMLAPGGVLLLVESTRNSRLILTTVGFFEDGFSHLEDERKANYLPLLAPDQWCTILERQGFSHVRAFPQNNQVAAKFDRHLIVAQAPEAVKVFRPEKLSDWMQKMLPDYMVPTEYVLLDQLPLSANGKVDRKALAKLGGKKESLPKKAHVAPSTQTEINIASVWEEVLNCSTIGIHDSFFARGGDSLRAIQCINLLKERYQIELSMQTLFEYSTICMLAEFIDTSASETEQLAANYDEGTI
ncbi:non-ribosomal peptide synthetase [Brevibacillus laterosporus]|uniref:non-ribosomal peptide synthetase n=1 Tax=Brevibacillus laterosporus TaxID=1465 RepID=UPI00264EC479|nr:non-ribosomal peptide synthetase [Brevibacillus laterosporus]MDN9011168.1 amino acid adenylation domain-containing protein [Brevibacillus laterosporus]MDO0942191.1 amino acid adenylation domain-containing protein [Brevibacillus laterosporus]